MFVFKPEIPPLFERIYKISKQQRRGLGAPTHANKPSLTCRMSRGSDRLLPILSFTTPPAAAAASSSKAPTPPAARAAGEPLPLGVLAVQRSTKHHRRPAPLVVLAPTRVFKHLPLAYVGMLSSTPDDGPGGCCNSSGLVAAAVGNMRILQTSSSRCKHEKPLTAVANLHQPQDNRSKARDS